MMAAAARMTTAATATAMPTAAASAMVPATAATMLDLCLLLEVALPAPAAAATLKAAEAALLRLCVETAPSGEATTETIEGRLLEISLGRNSGEILLPEIATAGAKAAPAAAEAAATGKSAQATLLEKLRPSAGRNGRRDIGHRASRHGYQNSRLPP